MKPLSFSILALCLVLFSCKKEETTTAANLTFQFAFDPTQPRLNNLGLPATLPANHAALTPDFHSMSVHWIELAPTQFTQIGQGIEAFKGAETAKGGENAVDFDKALVGTAGQVFLKIPLKNLAPGKYEWIRASVTFQNFDVIFNLHNVPSLGQLDNVNARIASFLGFNSYLSTVKPKEMTFAVNDDKKQGFWVLETTMTGSLAPFNTIVAGDAPAGATTVVNPLAGIADIPTGSCIITGKFVKPLEITGKEQTDLAVTLSFSTNQSVEWEEKIVNGKLDFDAADPFQNERIVDMGLRGLSPSWK